MRRRALTTRIARKVVQLGFLALALYPLWPMIYKRVTYKPAPTLTSWLLPWDPLLFLGNVLHRDWEVLVIGAPLLLLAATLILGRFFCGWVCPMGTLLDLVRPLAFWQRRRARLGKEGGLFPRHKGGPLKYYMLAAALVGSLFSLTFLGVFDPLVIFHRAATSLTTNILVFQQPLLRIYLSASLVTLLILGLELWQPRFWCRHLCPLGALLSLFSRWSLLNRRVSTACTHCGACRRSCTMGAIPAEMHETNYSDCHLCLTCEGVCPQAAITFGFGTLAGKRWQAEQRDPQDKTAPRSPGRFVPQEHKGLGINLSRRNLLTGVGAGVVGLAFTPVRGVIQSQAVVRPPGALPEQEFLRTCILCQECVRVCPTAGIRPALFGAGLAGIGTPVLRPRQGACSLLTTCPNLCARACPVGAIRPIPPEAMKMGLATVNHHLCLAWDQGVKCLVCVEACLVNAAQVYGGRVTVDPQLCTGCGRCENACPVVGSAIRVYPTTPHS
jgi:MauM/NapG family ferredoxin protein